MATWVTSWASSQSRKAKSSAAVVPKVCTCSRVPFDPGTRTQAATVCLCTSSPHTRSISRSMVPPPRVVSPVPGGASFARLCSACSMATMRGADRSHVRLFADSRYQLQSTFPGIRRAVSIDDFHDARVCPRLMAIIFGLGLIALASRLPGDHAPLVAGLCVDRQVADGEVLLLAVAFDVHLRHAVDDADTAVNTHAPILWGDAAVVRLAGAQVRDVLGLRLEPRGGVHVRQVVGQRGVERGPVALAHRLEAAIVGAQHVGLDPGHRLGPRWRHDTLLYTPAAMGRALARARHAGITCLPNISIDCSARSCGMVSVCVISMT